MERGRDLGSRYRDVRSRRRLPSPCKTSGSDSPESHLTDQPCDPGRRISSARARGSESRQSGGSTGPDQFRRLESRASEEGSLLYAARLRCLHASVSLHLAPWGTGFIPRFSFDRAELAGRFREVLREGHDTREFGNSPSLGAYVIGRSDRSKAGFQCSGEAASSSGLTRRNGHLTRRLGRCRNRPSASSAAELRS